MTLFGRNSCCHCISYSWFTLLMLCTLHTQIFHILYSYTFITMFLFLLDKLAQEPSLNFWIQEVFPTQRQQDCMETKQPKSYKKTLKIFLQKIKDRFHCLAEFKLQSEWEKKTTVFSDEKHGVLKNLVFKLRRKRWAFVPNSAQKMDFNH